MKVRVAVAAAVSISLTLLLAFAFFVPVVPFIGQERVSITLAGGGWGAALWYDGTYALYPWACPHDSRYVALPAPPCVSWDHPVILPQLWALAAVDLLSFAFALVWLRREGPQPPIKV